MPPDVRVFDTTESLYEAAAAGVVEAAREALGARGTFHWALAGGNTPRPVYALLAEPARAALIDWGRTQVFFGDERMVPPDHPQSNYRMARDSLIARVPIPAGNVHRIEGEFAPDEAAHRYRKALRALPRRDDLPVFDLVLLGVGADGHIASLFPGTAALDERDEPVVAVYVPRFSAWRVSLTLPVINAARRVLVLAAGTDKAAVLATVRGDGVIERLPAQRLRDAVWLVDREAANPVAPSRA